MFARATLAAISLSLAACQSMSPQASAPAAPAAPAAAPPPAWQQGRGADMSASTLAPIAGRMTATPVSEIPLADFKVPAGFQVEIWASGMPGARMMARPTAISTSAPGPSAASTR